MRLRAYARHRKAEGLIGGTLGAVQQAITSGRLEKSVGRDANGKPLILDAGLADREWFANTRADRVPIAVAARAKEIPKEATSAAAVAGRLAELIETDLLERNRQVLDLMPYAVEGAVAALAEVGRAGELAQALHLDDEDAGVMLAAELLSIADGERDGEREGDRQAIARDVGREAVAEGLR